MYTLLARYPNTAPRIGLIKIQANSKWGFVSYECSARASEMIKKNPQLIQRQSIRGKSGATYYGYRINPYVTVDMIQDPDLRTFHRIIKERMKKQEI